MDLFTGIMAVVCGVCLCQNRATIGHRVPMSCVHTLYHTQRVHERKVQLLQAQIHEFRVGGRMILFRDRGILSIETGVCLCVSMCWCLGWKE
uniref:Putative secreted protein n=1 Tax=Anopheles darlingi TaxID=43151 RepID=A0A2M4D3N2_ANODA